MSLLIGMSTTLSRPCLSQVLDVIVQVFVSALGRGCSARADASGITLVSMRGLSGGKSIRRMEPELRRATGTADSKRRIRGAPMVHRAQRSGCRGRSMRDSYNSASQKLLTSERRIHSRSPENERTTAIPRLKVPDCARRYFPSRPPRE